MFYSLFSPVSENGAGLLFLLSAPSGCYDGPCQRFSAHCQLTLLQKQSSAMPHAAAETLSTPISHPIRRCPKDPLRFPLHLLPRFHFQRSYEQPEESGCNAPHVEKSFQPQPHQAPEGRDRAQYIFLQYALRYHGSSYSAPAIRNSASVDFANAASVGAFVAYHVDYAVLAA